MGVGGEGCACPLVLCSLLLLSVLGRLGLFRWMGVGGEGCACPLVLCSLLLLSVLGRLGLV